MPQDERRAARRYLAHLPIVATDISNGGTIGVTRDVSTNGLFFYADSLLIELSLMELSMIQLALDLPPEITGSGTMHVVCDGMVMRVEKGESGRVGVAVRIKRYQAFN